MTHYDPLREIDGLDEPTVSALADSYDINLDEDAGMPNAMADLATALNEIGPQTMDDTAKHNAVVCILSAMKTLNNLNGTSTELLLQTESQESEMSGEDFDYETEVVTVRMQPDSN